jgi:hypothetical protein
VFQEPPAVDSVVVVVGQDCVAVFFGSHVLSFLSEHPSSSSVHGAELAASRFIPGNFISVQYE